MIIIYCGDYNISGYKIHENNSMKVRRGINSTLPVLFRNWSK